MEKIDCEMLEKIVETTEYIYDTYTSLYELEVSGKKDTHAYKNFNDYLTLLINEEVMYYDYFRNNPSVIPEVLSTLCELSPYDMSDTTTLVLNNDEKELKQSRIITSFFVLLNDCIGEDHKVEEMISKYNLELNKRNTNILLNEYNNNDYFIWARYLISFINKDLEKLNNNNCFINHERTFDKRIHKEYLEYSLMRQDIASEMVTALFADLLFFDEDDLDDIESRNEFDYLLVNFRTSLLLFKDDERQRVIQTIKEELTTRLDNDSNIKEILLDTLDNITKDIIEANKDTNNKGLRYN